MSNWTKGLIVLALMAASFAGGYYLTPTKTVIKTVTVEVEKKTSDKTQDTEKNKHKKVIITETTYPDGRKEKVTVIDYDFKEVTHSDQHDTSDTSKTTSDSKEVSRAGPKWHIAGLGGLDIHSSLVTPVYGAAVSRDILGPISVGAFGLTNGVGGVSIGISF
jgi:hypothetical protein